MCSWNYHYDMEHVCNTRFAVTLFGAPQFDSEGGLMGLDEFIEQHATETNHNAVSMEQEPQDVTVSKQTPDYMCREWLYEQVVEKLRSDKEISGEYDVSPETIRYHRQKHSIEQPVDHGRESSMVFNLTRELERSGQNIDWEADGYVYILWTRDPEGVIRHYVGETTSLKPRLSSHLNKGGDFTAYVEQDGEYYKLKPDNFWWEIKLCDIVNLYKHGISGDFNAYRKAKERELYQRYAIMEYTRVLGGR